MFQGCKMEQYDKGEVRVVEAPPIFVLNETGIEMKVNAGSKIRNLMGFAMKKMKVCVNLFTFISKLYQNTGDLRYSMIS